MTEDGTEVDIDKCVDCGAAAGDGLLFHQNASSPFQLVRPNYNT